MAGWCLRAAHGPDSTGGPAGRASPDPLRSNHGRRRAVVRLGLRILPLGSVEVPLLGSTRKGPSGRPPERGSHTVPARDDRGATHGIVAPGLAGRSHVLGGSGRAAPASAPAGRKGSRRDPRPQRRPPRSVCTSGPPGTGTGWAGSSERRHARSIPRHRGPGTGPGSSTIPTRSNPAARTMPTHAWPRRFRSGPDDGSRPGHLRALAAYAAVFCASLLPRLPPGPSRSAAGEQPLRRCDLPLGAGVVAARAGPRWVAPVHA